MALSAVLPQLLYALPQLLTFLVGVVLLVARRSRMAATPRWLGIVACLVLGAGVLGQVSFTTWVVIAPLRSGMNPAQVGTLLAVGNIGFAVLHTVGVALLLASTLTGRAPASPVPR